MSDTAPAVGRNRLPNESRWESKMTTKPEPPVSTNSDQATRIERLLASIIDAVILIAVMVPITFLLAALGLYGLSILSTLLASFIAVGVFLAINFAPLQANGQTWGKKVIGIKIVSQATGEILEIQELLLMRYAPVWGVGLIPWIGPLFVLADACFIFRENELCFHDDIAKTRVVKA